MTFVRYRSPHPNARGARVGIFALANGLRATGKLSPTELEWLRENNAWYDAAYAERDVEVFDRSAHPIVECWFKSDATAVPVSGRFLAFEAPRIARKCPLTVKAGLGTVLLEEVRDRRGDVRGDIST